MTLDEAVTEVLREWLKRASESPHDHERTAASLVAFLAAKSNLTAEEYATLVSLCARSWP